MSIKKKKPAHTLKYVLIVEFYTVIVSKLSIYELVILLEFGHFGPTTTSFPSHFGP